MDEMPSAAKARVLVWRHAPLLFVSVIVDGANREKHRETLRTKGTGEQQSRETSWQWEFTCISGAVSRIVSLAAHQPNLQICLYLYSLRFVGLPFNLPEMDTVQAVYQ